jgi:Flp pilus assembly protein TadG
MRKKTRGQTRHGGSLGQSLVEFALTLPLLVLIVMGVFDLGRAIYANTVLANAASEGARTGVIATKTDADISNAVKSTAVGLATTDSPLHISISPSPTRTSGGTVTVMLTYTFTAITPLIGNIFGPTGNLILQSSATMTVE